MLSFYAANVPAAVVGKDLCAVYCTGLYSCPSTYKQDTAAAEMCWSLGINHPSKKWRLDWCFLTNISQQNSNGKVRGEKQKVTVFHKHINWMSAHGLHSPLLFFFAEGLYFSNGGYPILNGLLQKVCLKWQFVLCKYTHRLGSIFLFPFLNRTEKSFS